MKSLCIVLLLALSANVDLSAHTHWQRQSIGGQSVSAIAAADSLDYVALGGWIVGTRDGGFHWDSLFAFPPSSMSLVAPRVSSTISYSGMGVVHSTRDLIIVAADSLNDLTFWHDSIHSFPPDSEEYIRTGVIARSSDSGRSWSATSGGQIDAIAALDRNHI